MQWTGEVIRSELNHIDLGGSLGSYVDTIGRSADEMIRDAFSVEDTRPFPHSYPPHLAPVLLADVEAELDHVLALRHSRQELERQFVGLLWTLEEDARRCVAAEKLHTDIVASGLAEAFDVPEAPGELAQLLRVIMARFPVPFDNEKRASLEYSQTLSAITASSRQARLSQTLQMGGAFNAIERTTRLDDRIVVEARLAYRKALAASSGLGNTFGITTGDFRAALPEHADWIEMSPPSPTEPAFVDRMTLWVTAASHLLDRAFLFEVTKEYIFGINGVADNPGPLMDPVIFDQLMAPNASGLLRFQLPMPNPNARIRVREIGVSFTTRRQLDSNDEGARAASKQIERSIAKIVVEPPAQFDEANDGRYRIPPLAMHARLFGNPIDYNSDPLVRNIDPYGNDPANSWWSIWVDPILFSARPYDSPVSLRAEIFSVNLHLRAAVDLPQFVHV